MRGALVWVRVLMEKDIKYNLEQARIWACLLNKDERALDFYDAHIEIVKVLTK